VQRTPGNVSVAGRIQRDSRGGSALNKGPVDERIARGPELGYEGTIGTAGGLICAGGRGEIAQRGAGHVRVARSIDRDTVSLSACTEVRGVDDSRPCGIHLGHETVATWTPAAGTRLISGEDREVARERISGHIRTPGSIDSD